MSSAYIRTRRVSDGSVRYDVRYRRGGRGFRVEHGGTFKTQREAKIRKQAIDGALAAGTDPREAIRQSLPKPKVLGREHAAAYRASRIDLADFPEAHLERFNAAFGDRELEHETWLDVQAFVNRNADLKPTSLRKYLQTAKQIFDFAGVEPNPARDRRLRLPRVVHEEIVPPTGRQVLLILDKVTRRERRLPFVTMEQTGMTIGEVCSLAWGDVDIVGSQFRLKRSNVKGQIGARARWVQVPDWLMAIIEETCPLEDRTAERLVFPFTVAVLQSTMRTACRDAGVPLFSPHDLRHRRISLWHGQGVPTRELSSRVGHAKPSMTLDVYSHVMPDDEINVSALEALLVGDR